MVMDEKCNTGFCFGMKNGIGRNTREEDRKYALRPPLNGPPMQLDLFPVASVMPQASGSLDLRSSSGTLRGEKTSPRIDGGGDGHRSEGGPNAGIRQVPESRGIDVSKLSAPFYYNGVSSPHNTIYWNAKNPASGHDMDLKRKSVALYELDIERVHSRVLSVLEEQGGSKKKLRVSKEQCDILEASFRNNNSPEFKRKQALASQMNLLPGKVEVWFQNRRGRSKLKQTEMDCEVLKRCNESLADENRKLHKELQGLRALKFASPLSVCPSCAKVAPAGNPGAFTLANVKSVFTQGVSPH